MFLNTFAFIRLGRLGFNHLLLCPIYLITYLIIFFRSLSSLPLCNLLPSSFSLILYLCRTHFLASLIFSVKWGCKQGILDVSCRFELHERLAWTISLRLLEIAYTSCKFELQMGNQWCRYLQWWDWKTRPNCCLGRQELLGGRLIFSFFVTVLARIVVGLRRLGLFLEHW